jgi:hypothetical protein
MKEPRRSEGRGPGGADARISSIVPDKRIVAESHQMIGQRRALDLTFGIAVLGGLFAAMATLGAATRVGAPTVLRVLIPLWNGAPWAAVAVLCVISATWHERTRRRFQVVVQIVAVLAALAYLYFAFITVRPPTAAFVLIAPLTLVTIVIALAMSATGRLE